MEQLQIVELSALTKHSVNGGGGWGQRDYFTSILTAFMSPSGCRER